MKTLNMTLNDFCKVYEMLLNLQKVEMNVPAVLVPAYYDAVLRLGIRGEISRGKPLSWNEIIDYLLYQMKLNLKNFCCPLLNNSNVCDVQIFMSFLANHQELVTFMGKDIFSFLLKVRRSFSLNEDEEILKTKSMFIILQTYAYDESVHRCFLNLMRMKLKCFADTLAFSSNYQIFFDWMLPWKNLYPDVWKALQISLKTMKKSKKLNLNCDEHRKLYDFYCSKL